MDTHSDCLENKENSPDFLPPPTPLLKRIGYGTGVSVYHMDRSPCNHATRSPWALKTINKQLIGSRLQKRLETEAKILQELKHPNIVGFRGFSKTEDGRKVLAMEECTRSLGDLIENHVEAGGLRFSASTILTVVGEVSKALQYLHEEKGLLHGDLKSFNVLIKGDFEEIKLCDFGVSMKIETAVADDYIGTGAWSAPEALMEGPITDRADIFSLGLIIWEMLMLKVPHTDDIQTFSSNNSSDGDFDSFKDNFGKTPELPERLSDEYDLVVDIFKWCTLQDWKQRPRARDILDKLTKNHFPLTKPPVEITL